MKEFMLICCLPSDIIVRRDVNKRYNRSKDPSQKPQTPPDSREECSSSLCTTTSAPIMFRRHSFFHYSWLDPSFKPYPDVMDSTDSDFPSTLDNMDYAMGIDPISLQFYPCALNFAAFDDLANPMSSATFGDPYSTFSFQYPPATQVSEASSSPPLLFMKERRLSVTSSSSSSGVSLSPMLETASSPPSGYASDRTSTKEESKLIHDAVSLHTSDPATELAQQVQQAAGVMLAVPMNGFASSFQGAFFVQLKIFSGRLFLFCGKGPAQPQLNFPSPGWPVLILIVRHKSHSTRPIFCCIHPTSRNTTVVFL